MTLRELLGATVEVGRPDFEVAHPVVDRPLVEGFGHVLADSEYAVLRIPDVGTFAIARGERVFCDIDPQAPPGAVSMWLHGTVAALLLAQRGRFALHASVVDVNGSGIALAGRRRTGKTTTALRLEQLGYPLVTDDVSPLEVDGGVIVRPFTRPVHVHATTAATLGLPVGDAEPVLPQHTKLALAAPLRDAVPLAAVAVLGVGPPDAAAPPPRTARGAEAHWLVGSNVYRAELLVELWQLEMFDWASAVAAVVPVYVVTRRSERWTVDEVARTIELIAGASGRPREGGARGQDQPAPPR
jgi:hypothetical protein